MNNTIFDTANNSVTSWGDELRNAYYEYDDGEVILVTGDERQYF